MAVVKWILTVLLFCPTSNAHETDNVATYFLENCTTPIVVKLHKDQPNSIAKIHLFDTFPEKPLRECRSGIYAYVEEFYTAWHKSSLSQSLSNYKVLVTLEDLNWPKNMCDRIFCLVEDAQRNSTTFCDTLDENLFNYRFDLNYRRFLPLQKDFFLDMSIAVAYLPDSYGNNDCPSDQYFQCVSDSLCIPSRFWCDDINHCSDRSDETDCKGTQKPFIPAAGASSEESLPEDPSSVSVTSSEDYSSEENTESVTLFSSTAAKQSPSTVVTSPSTTESTSPATVKLTTSTQPAPSKTTVLTPKVATEATAKIPVQKTKPPSTPKQVSSPTTKITTTTSTTRHTSSSSTTPSTTPHTSSSSTTPSKITTPSLTAISSTTSAPTPRTTQQMIRFPLSKKPSSKPSDNSIVAASAASPTAATSKEVSTQATSKNFPTTERSSTLRTSPTTEGSASRTSPNNHQKNLFDIEIKNSNEIHDDAVPSSPPKPPKKPLSTKYNDAPYPFGPRSDRLDSRSRNSPAIRTAPNQWVLVTLCLILVFIYFFL